MTPDANEKSADTVLNKQGYSMLNKGVDANVIYIEAATLIKYEVFLIKFVKIKEKVDAEMLQNSKS